MRPKSRSTTRGRVRHRTAGRSALLALAVAGALGLVAACDDSTTEPQGEARVQVLLTDFPLEAIASADVSISRVYLTGGGQGQVDLFHDVENPHQMNLLELQDGVTLDLTGEVPVPEGNYGQLRFVVDDAHITLEEGFTFNDGSSEMALTVPSGFFRVILNGEEDEEDDSGSVELVGGETTVLLVDFDVAGSFVFQGPPTSPIGVLFKPVLKQLEIAP